ncbi:sugar ABC transporter permease [Paenibacillus sp. R14(2021)]|uniref:ABC transporter permease n=1 Tax=Paenibacillus sp. R14(2021) TaxID=2859228 RepID=UPI001C613479|nr:ABC transporter permease subunit [Paenibacillus sp. R14(2021)]
MKTAAEPRAGTLAPKKDSNAQKRAGFQLFLLTTPLLAVVLLFCYYPLYGWIYAFFDYHAGMKLSDTPFVGLKHFAALVDNAVTREDIVRVLRNTFAISFLGILTSPLPAIFAICLTEVRFKRFQRLVQTLTTLPNFISWILVYAVAWSVFSVGDGFLNRFLLAAGLIHNEINFLATDSHIWLTMLAYATWKGLGWSAIIYLAAIASIEQELYEAATVDGAGRFARIWHITVPGLMPTFFVLLLLSIANFINNGLEQYFVFQNPMNKGGIEVLDLFVYNQGMLGNDIPFATVVSMLKSVVSIVLLFAANAMSRAIRKESII